MNALKIGSLTSGIVAACLIPFGAGVAIVGGMAVGVAVSLWIDYRNVYGM